IGRSRPDLRCTPCLRSSGAPTSPCVARGGRRRSPRPIRSSVRVTTGTYAHLLVEDLRAAVDAHAPVPLALPKTRDSSAPPHVDRHSAAAFLLHETGSANGAPINSPQNRSESGADDGGRCRIRTC